MKRLALFSLFSTFLLAAEMTPPELRAHINTKIESIETEVIDVDAICDTKIKSVPVRIYGEGEGGILFLHGGAWIAGSLETHDNVCRYLNAYTGKRVVSVDYTLAPEGHYPKPIEEAYTVLQEMGEETILIGDSAGGNLCAALSLLARDRNGPKIALQILVNPSLNLASENNYFFAKHYATDDEMGKAYASPLKAPSLKNVPETLILLAEEDPLYSEGEEFAKQLERSGSHVTVYTQLGTGHLAGQFARATEQASPSLEAIVSYINVTLPLSKS